jgi:type IV fimbrial biogenesis protein FimT
MSLIEMIIGVAILAIVMGIAAPSFWQWARNIQIKNAAESVLSGIQRARAEAVARNTNVSFTIDVTDAGWAVDVVAPPSQIDARERTEGSQDTTVTILPAVASQLTFNNYGILVPNADGDPAITQLDFAANGGSKSMRVMIGVGGNAKMCDPSLVPGSKPSAC